MSKKRSYDDALSALGDILSEREKEIDAREEKLQKAEENFEVDRSAVYGSTGPSDVLHLNIGGTKATVLRRTLTSIPGSMLASKFSGRWDDSLEKDEDGKFFIDQEYSLFQPMLAYLRNKANVTGKYPMKSPGYFKEGIFSKRNTMNDFDRMVEYYGMTNGIYPTNLTIHTGQKDSVEIIGPRKVNARDWTTLQLANEGHKRIVKSYEVTLGNVQRIQIGWKAHTVKFENRSGVGDVGYSHALDLSRSTYLAAGEATAVAGLDQEKGTIVRSEDFGLRWYVNGELLEITKITEPLLSTLGMHQNGTNICPIISLKGEVEITSLELVN